jgi:hypothetical protein
LIHSGHRSKESISGNGGAPLLFRALRRSPADAISIQSLRPETVVVQFLVKGADARSARDHAHG